MTRVDNVIVTWYSNHRGALCAVLLLHLKRNLWNSTDCSYITFLSPFLSVGKVSASTSPPPLPAPLLEVLSRSRDSVLLVCRAPPGHLGVMFMLHKVTEEVIVTQMHMLSVQVIHTPSLGFLWLFFFFSVPWGGHTRAADGHAGGSVHSGSSGRQISPRRTLLLSV